MTKKDKVVKSEKTEVEKVDIKSVDVGVIEEAAKKLLSLMGSTAKVEVVPDVANEAVLVNLESSEETGLLIGRHGETILALQTILGMMVRQLTGQWVRIMVNVGDWREKEEAHLKELAVSAADRAKETGEPQYLYNLSSAQRRIIHLFLAEDAEIKTESQGEGKERFLVIGKA